MRTVASIFEDMTPVSAYGEKNGCAPLLSTYVACHGRDHEMIWLHIASIDSIDICRRACASVADLPTGNIADMSTLSR